MRLVAQQLSTFELAALLEPTRSHQTVPAGFMVLDASVMNMAHMTKVNEICYMEA